MKCECGCLLEKFQLVCEICGREVFDITIPKPDENTSNLYKKAEGKIREFIIQCKEKGLLLN